MKKIIIDVDELKALRADGVSVDDLATHFRCSVAKIMLVIKAEGLQYKNHKAPLRTRDSKMPSREELSKMYEETPSMEVIAERLGVNFTTVRDWMIKYDLKRNRKMAQKPHNLDLSKPWTQKEKLVEVYVNQGLGTRTIAKLWGCDQATILNWLRKFDIPRRPPTNPNHVYKSQSKAMELKTYVSTTKERKRLGANVLSKLRKFAKCCERCGWNNYVELLELHHLDQNCANNVDTNLTYLCPICHALDTRRILRISELDQLPYWEPKLEHVGPNWKVAK